MRRSWGTVLAAALLGPVLAGAASPPRASAVTSLFADGLESGSFSAWPVVRTAGGGTATVQTIRVRSGSFAARLSEGASGGSYAYARAVLATAQADVTAAGDFFIEKGGTTGNVPLLRLFDPSGSRLLSVYRQDGRDNRLWVQHSGAYNATSGLLPLGRWAHAEVRAVTGGNGASMVEVRLDGTLVHRTTAASLGTSGVAAVQIGNDTANQAFVLYADNVAVSGSDGPVATPCDANAQAPSTSDPGTVVVADSFESGDLSNWSKVTQEGDATIRVQTTDVRSGRCALRDHVSSQWSSLANVTKTLPAGSRGVWADGWFKVERQGVDTNRNTPTFRLFAGGKRIFDVSRQNGDGKLFVRYPDGNGGWTVISTGRRPSVGVWYRYKIHVVAAGSTSTAEVWLDGTRVFTTTKATFGTTRVDVLMVGAEHHRQDGDVVADDIVVKTIS